MFHVVEDGGVVQQAFPGCRGQDVFQSPAVHVVQPGVEGVPEPGRGGYLPAAQDASCGHHQIEDATVPQCLSQLQQPRRRVLFDVAFDHAVELRHFDTPVRPHRFVVLPVALGACRVRKRPDCLYELRRGFRIHGLTPPRNA